MDVLKALTEEEATKLINDHLAFLKSAQEHLLAPNYTREDAIWVLTQLRQWLRLLEPALDLYESAPKYEVKFMNLTTNIACVLLAINSVEKSLVNEKPLNKWWMA